MSSRAHIAEVKVKYIGTPKFDSFQAEHIREFLETNDCQIFSTTNDNDGCAFNWEIDKEDINCILENWDEMDFGDYEDYPKDELKEFLKELVNSNKGSSVCHVHWW